MKPRILVVDDEESIREFLEIMLKREGHTVKCAKDGAEALKILEKESYDMCITDLQMPKVSGIELLAKSHEINPHMLVLIITAYGTTESAVEAMKRGAYDYITKPFKIDEIKIIIKKAFERRNLERENLQLKKALGTKYSFQNIVGSSSAMLELFEMIQRVSQTKTNILITGESGTGKEMVAKAIHFNGPLKDKSFVTVNCGAIPETLMESELFGHKKGSFTGAVADKEGLFKVADGGTIFLDEIGDLPLLVQVKLLRAIQEKTFKIVGGTEDISVDVRIISATNRDLYTDVKKGRFREDLFYRLNVIQIHTPALRQRKEDIPLLAQHFVEKHGKELGKEVQKIAKEALDYLMAYDYPGNVRELENIIERAVALEAGPAILAESLPKHLLALSGRAPLGESLTPEFEWKEAGVKLEKIVEAIEKRYMAKALEQAGGIKKDAAKLLGISFRSMRYRFDKYGL